MTMDSAGYDYIFSFDFISDSDDVRITLPEFSDTPDHSFCDSVIVLDASRISCRSNIDVSIDPFNERNPNFIAFINGNQYECVGSDCSYYQPLRSTAISPTAIT